MIRVHDQSLDVSITSFFAMRGPPCDLRSWYVPNKLLNDNLGSSLYQVGRLNCNFPSLRYIISMIFFVVLKPLALLFAD